LKRIFHVIPEPGAGAIQPVLNLRVGADHLSFVITDKGSGRLYELSYWTTDLLTATGLTECLSPYPGHYGPFFQVTVCYDYPTGQLIPSADIAIVDAGEVGQLLPGSALSITESVADWQLFNVFSPPREIHDWLQTRFPSAHFIHQYTQAFSVQHT